jgi:hypothetical protein
MHVAAVNGEPGRGYTPVHDLAGCVENVLARMDLRSAEVSPPLESVIMPLLGAGQARAQPEMIFPVLLEATLDYLAAHPASLVNAVWFIAFTDHELEACRRVLDSTSRLRALSESR